MEEVTIDGYLHRKYMLGEQVMKVEVHFGGKWMDPLEVLALRKWSGQPWLRTYDGRLSSNG